MPEEGPYACDGCGAHTGTGECEFCKRCDELGNVNGSTAWKRKARRSNQ